MSEEVDVNINQIGSNADPATTMFDSVRRIMLASLGAVALTRDEAENFVNKLVDRGELAQKDAERLIGEMRTKLRQKRPTADQVEERVEQGVEQFLNRLNIPSKRDIDDLTTKIAQLTARVEELRRKQE